MEQARIYIVEDEALISLELKDRLEKIGYDVCGTSARGEDALPGVVGLRPDLVLMDIHLAGTWDGIETAERVRMRMDVPVVYVTAYSDAALVERAKRSEPFGYLMKPFNERELYATVDTALYKSRTERRMREMNRQLQASVEKLEQQRREILRLHRMGEALQICGSAEEAYGEIKRSLTELFPTLPGFLAVLAPGDSVLQVKESWGGLTVSTAFPARECPTAASGVMDARGTGHPGLACIQTSAPAPHSYLCMPLKTRSRVMGLLHLAQSTDQDALPLATAELARAAAETIALSLGNLFMRDALNEQTIRDPLTGLYNRRYLEDTLGHQVAQAARNGNLVGLMMLDLDHFKEFNDTHGHAAGDLLLREFGGYVRKHIRQGDYVCRYGGEEFVVVLPHSPIEATRRRAEELRQGLPALTFEHLGNRLGGITVSIGIAQCPEDGKSAETLLRSADGALYRAKAGGRDRVESAAGGEGGHAERQDLHRRG